MKTNSGAKIMLQQTELLSFVDHLRSNNAKIVFTNGVFDILHAGHVDYLEKAGKLGDALIVAVNSDESVKALKGNSRPIIGLAQRIKLLSALECVDAVTVFSEATPIKVIESVLPDVLVKGADYVIENIVGATEVIENGGEVMTIAIEEQISSTEIIDKIKNL